MAVRKLTTGKWLCECYPAGRSGRRVRKQFATKGEALAFERHTMEETEAKPWLGESVDRRTLKDVVELWFKLHGKSLTAGQHVYDKLLLMVDALGNPLATDLTSKMFAHYRDKRLTGEIYFSEKWKKGASPVTINLEQSYLSSVFSELSRLGEWSYPNPLENMRKFTIAEKEMAWLTHEQIVELLADCKRQDPILALVVKICLSTGARWREAVNLTRSQVTKYRITFVRTKGKKNRSIPISAPSRSTHTRSAPYVCSALHDVGWKHSGLTKNSRTPRYKNDYALRTSGTGSSRNGAPFQSSGNAAKWRQSGGSGWHYPVITTTDHQPNLLFLI